MLLFYTSPEVYTIIGMVSNGKVERSHRKDNEYFYASHKFYSFEDFKNQLAVRCRNYNRFPIRPLGWLSPIEYLAKYTTDTSLAGSVTHH